MSLEFLHQDVAPPAQAAGPLPTTGPDDQLPERPLRPRQLWLRSLTSRLVAGVVSLVVVLLAVIGTCTYLALRDYLLNRLDQQVGSAAAQNASYIGHCLDRTAIIAGQGSVTCFGGPPPTEQEWFIVLNKAGAAIMWPENTENLSRLTLPAAQRASVVSDPNRTFTTSLGGQQLRVQAQQIDNGDIVLTGLSTFDVDRTLSRLVRLEMIIGIAGVAVAFLATSWGVRRSLRNLYRVSGTAQEVAAELSASGTGLDRRVPIVEEGTEVGQLAESMNTLLGAVETQFAARVESERRMRQFLADASHELRTPLTSIRGYAELARMRRAAGEAEQDDLQRIESEGTRMSRLVDDLLLLARGDADAAEHAGERQPVDLADVLDDAVSGSRAAFPSRPIDVEVAPIPNVLGDRDQLVRVVRNLITNAAVHTADGRPIHVRGYTDAGGAVISVADGGPGLPPEQAAHVFERFWRADKARTRARGGTGLGLSIVSAIVSAHGGSVRFDSAVETGSTVTVWLPGHA